MPRFAGLATMMRLPAADSPQGLDAAFIGVPLDIGTSNRAGARFGCGAAGVYACPAAGAVSGATYGATFGSDPWTTTPPAGAGGATAGVAGGVTEGATGTGASPAVWYTHSRSPS